MKINKVSLRRLGLMLCLSTLSWLLIASVFDVQSQLRYEPGPFQRDVSDVTESSYFTFNRTLNRNDEDKYIITGEDICDNVKTQFILILIPSVPKDLNVRNILRNTWINALKTNSWPSEKLQFEFRLAFLFGNGYSEEDNKLLNAEKEVYKDIVQGDFVDNFKNITMKIALGLKWVAKYCFKARYVMKTNVNTFVHVPRFLKKIQTYNDSLDGKIFCRLHENTVPDRNKEVHFSNLQYYPPYCDGAVYVISGGEAIKKIVRASSLMPFVQREDVYITGIVAKVAKVNRINILPKVNFQNTPEWECIFQYSDESDPVYLADSGYSPSQIKNIWKCLKSGPDFYDYTKRVNMYFVYFIVTLLVVLKFCFPSVCTISQLSACFYG